MPVTSYSRTPSSNNSAPPNGAPEGMVFSAVNDTLRQLMADTVQEAAKGSARVLSSVSGTNTITATMTPDLDAYTAGMIVVLTPANTSTGAVTLNIDSLGALDVLGSDGAALNYGDLVAGIPVVLVLDSGADDWLLVSPACSAGTFTATVTGVSGTVTGTVNYRKQNGQAILWANSNIYGTSNSGELTFSGLPAALRPVARRSCPCYITYGGGGAGLAVAELTNGVDAADVIRFYLTMSNSTSAAYLSANLFTSSGDKGLPAGWSISYPL